MLCSAFNSNMWNVLATEEYLTWFSNLSESGKDEKLFYKNLVKEAIELIELYKDYNWEEER